MNASGQRPQVQWQFDGPDCVTAICLYPDEQTLLVGTADGRLTWVDASTGHARCVAPPLETGPQCLSASPNSPIVASGGSGGSVRLWDASGQVVGQFNSGVTTIDHLAWSPDGSKLAAVAGMHLFALGEIGTQLLFDRTLDNNITGIGWSPRSSSLWTAGNGGILQFSSETEWHSTSYSCPGSLTSLGVGSDGQFVAAGAQDSTVRIWQLSAGLVTASTFPPQMTARFKAAKPAVVWRPGHRQLVQTGTEQLVLWTFSDAPIGAVPTAKVLRLHQARSTAIAISSTGDVLASAAQDGGVALWSLRDLSIQPNFLLTAERVTRLALPSDGRQVFVGCRSGAVLAILNR
jgi:WD40 repeat protein